MFWTVNREHYFRRACRWCMARPERGRRSYLVAITGLAIAILAGCASPRATPPLTMPVSQSQDSNCDAMSAILRFVNENQRRSRAERADLVRVWQLRLTDPIEARCAALHLAVLFNRPDATKAERLRAAELLRGYMEGGTEDEVRHDFARHQMALLEERERCRKQLRQAKRDRLRLEHKLEALKTIELRMNDADTRGKLPLTGR